MKQIKMMLLVVLSFTVLMLNACKNDAHITTQGILFERIQNEDAYAVVGYTGESKDIYIAAYHDGLPVKKVSSDAFKDVAVIIETLVLPDTITELDRFCFSSLRLIEFRVPTSLTYFAQAFGSFKDTTFIIPSNHPTLKDTMIQGHKAIISNEEDELIYVYNTRNYNDVLIIPDSIEKIGHSALMFTSFSSIVLPNHIDIIGSYAFHETKSTSIYLPISIMSIEEAAFSVTNLSSDVIIPEGISIVKAFTFSDANIGSITLPDNLTYLSHNAFSNSRDGMSNHNHITRFEFNSFRLSGDNLEEFVNYFVFSTFRYGYYPGSNVQIILPSNSIEASILRNSLETSLSIAPTISSEFPDITFEFINPNE